MTYTRPFLRYVVSGVLYTDETFSYSMSFIQRADPGPANPPTSVPTAMVNATSIFFTSSGLISQYASLQRIKLNQIGTDGRYTEDDTVSYDYVPEIKGASSTGTAPQVALAITLDTGLRRGRASRGRFYLPTPGYSATPFGGISTSQQAAVLTATTTYLNALNASLVDWRLGVVSDIGSGTEHPVTNARVGQILDTIRSRRNKLSEAYAVGPALAP